MPYFIKTPPPENKYLSSYFFLHFLLQSEDFIDTVLFSLCQFVFPLSLYLQQRTVWMCSSKISLPVTAASAKLTIKKHQMQRRKMENKYSRKRTQKMPSRIIRAQKRIKLLQNKLTKKTYSKNVPVPKKMKTLQILSEKAVCPIVVPSSSFKILLPGNSFTH